jgi:hypothetical protein
MQTFLVIATLLFIYGGIYFGLSWGEAEQVVLVQPSEFSQNAVSLAPPFQISYGSTTQRLDQEWQFWLEESRVLNSLVTDLNQTFTLTEPLSLTVQECSPQARWVAVQDRQVILCYELLGYLSDAFDDLSASQREQELAALDVTYVLALQGLAQILAGSLTEAATLEQSQVAEDLLIALPILSQEIGQGTGATIALSGLLWMYNQGHLLKAVQRLAILRDWDLKTYERLICLTYGSHPNWFPYFKAEFEETSLHFDRCEPKAQRSIAIWKQSLTFLLKSP